MKMTLFKQRKPRGFNFQPRYYNPRKEALQNRIATIEREVQQEKQLKEKLGGESQYRAKMRRVSTDAITLKRSQNKKSNLRILLFAGLLAALFYLYLNTELSASF